MKFYLLPFFFIANLGIANASTSTEMVSPDESIRVTFELTKGAISYSMKFHGQELLERAPLGIRLSSPSATTDLSQGLKIERLDESTHNNSHILAFGKSHRVRDNYRQYDFFFVNQMILQFRIYDDGFAFRYRVSEQTGIGQIQALNELTQIIPKGNPKAYVLPLAFGSAYESPYLSAPLAELPRNQSFGLPLVLLYGTQAYMSISEADLHDYPQSYFILSSGTAAAFNIVYPGQQENGVALRSSGSLQTPWRVFILGDSAQRVLESNMITNLSEPSVEKDIASIYSWIHPGKVLFQWWNGYFRPGQSFSPPESVLNTQTLKDEIDFCARYGIEYFSLDGYEFSKAWYGGPVSPYAGQDVTQSAPDIALSEVFQYARARGVRVRIWLHTDAITDENRDSILSNYALWGASGIMVDFMGDDTQKGSARMEKILQTALKYHLSVAFHGNPKPTGLARTYPNYLTQEGVMGQEYDKWEGSGNTPDHDVNIAFIRGTVGPMDTHEGAFRPVPQNEFKAKSIAPNSIGTLARQLAMYVVYENEQPMLIDYPEAYEAHLDAFYFVREVPVTWDETRFIDGDLEEKFITIARRHGSDWYMGSLTGQLAHDSIVSLSFLGRGRFLVQKYADAQDSAVHGEAISISSNEIVTAKDSIEVNMAPAGGQAIHFVHLE